MSALTIIDTIRLQEICLDLMDGHVGYGLGAKAPLNAKPKDVRRIDCSGFVRYLIHNATESKLTLPDGSVVQNDWCRGQGLKAVDYKEAAWYDELIRIAFLPPRPGHAGHVWLTYMGRTLESHGHVGPNSRPWNTGVLLSQVRDCYVLALSPCLGDWLLRQEAYA